jgi:hypothetical protein
MTIRIRYNRDFGIYEVTANGAVVYQTMDRDDAREYALSIREC